MLDGAGKVRVMDFGIATAGGEDPARVGTPAYMAPEQRAGHPATARSDIYALGLVLYELFTGRSAVDGGDAAEFVRRNVPDITPPSELVRSMHPAIERAIMRCLDRQPDRRPSSALAVSALLPGGDPFGVALFAGETPSPEMVAAAGDLDAALSARAGVLLIVAFLSLARSRGMGDRPQHGCRPNPDAQAGARSGRVCAPGARPRRRRRIGTIRSDRFRVRRRRAPLVRRSWRTIRELEANQCRKAARRPLLVPSQPIADRSAESCRTGHADRSASLDCLAT